MLENLEGTPADELQIILGNLSPNAEAEEQGFIDQLRLMRRGLKTDAGEALAGPQEEATRGGAPFRGLVSEARKRGLTTEELADAAQLSVPLIIKLDLRQIRYSSIPRQVIEDVAGAIKRSAEQVAQYLQGDPLRTAALYAEADAAREEQEPQDFFHLVSVDTSLSVDRRSRLTGMAIR